MDVGESGQLRGWLTRNTSDPLSEPLSATEPLLSDGLGCVITTWCGVFTRAATQPKPDVRDAVWRAESQTDNRLVSSFFRPILLSIHVRMYVLTRGYGLLRRSHPHIVRPMQWTNCRDQPTLDGDTAATVGGLHNPPAPSTLQLASLPAALDPNVIRSHAHSCREHPLLVDN